MRIRCIGAWLLLLCLAACASTGYRTVLPGVNSLGQMQVTVDEGWLQVPVREAPYLRQTSRIYTRNGVDIDRLVLIPGVNDGETLFRDAPGLPAFRADMRPADTREITEASLVTLTGLQGATIDTGNPRPSGFGSHSGEIFDVVARSKSGQNYRGVAATVVAEERLYVMVYLAADPDPYDEYIAEATSVVESMAIRVKTIKTGGFD